MAWGLSLDPNQGPAPLFSLPRDSIVIFIFPTTASMWVRLQFLMEQFFFQKRLCKPFLCMQQANSGPLCQRPACGFPASPWLDLKADPGELGRSHFVRRNQRRLSQTAGKAETQRKRDLPPTVSLLRQPLQPTLGPSKGKSQQLFLGVPHE